MSGESVDQALAARLWPCLLHRRQPDHSHVRGLQITLMFVEYRVQPCSWNIGCSNLRGLDLLCMLTPPTPHPPIPTWHFSWIGIFGDAATPHPPPITPRHPPRQKLSEITFAWKCCNGPSRLTCKIREDRSDLTFFVVCPILSTRCTQRGAKLDLSTPRTQ